jgi:hypothetical protein
MFIVCLLNCSPKYVKTLLVALQLHKVRNTVSSGLVGHISAYIQIRDQLFSIASINHMMTCGTFGKSTMNLHMIWAARTV